ncbi:MAG: PAS domain-containing protein [Fimbriimonadaceae bacterium]|nr:PAS domain-containing protein [Fimbriimonadaceae bacterium]
MRLFEHRVARAVLAAGSLIVLIGLLGTRIASTDELKRLFDNIHWTAGYSTAAILSWIGYKMADELHRRQLIFFSLGLTSYVFGQICWDIQVATHWNPFPGPSDLFFLLYPGFFICGLWRCIRLSERGKRRLPVIIDAALMIAAMLVITLTIYLPRQGETPPFKFLVLTIYPVIFVAAVALGLLIIFYRRPKWGIGWLCLITGAVINAGLWMQWNVMTLDGTLADGTWFNFSFSAVAILIGIGAFYWRIEPSESNRYRRISESTVAFFPLLAVISAATAIILGYTLPHLTPNVRFTIEIGGLAIVILGVVAQGLLTSDLRVSKDRLELAARASADGIWDWNIQGGETVYSEGYRRMLGYESNEFPNVDTSFFSHLHPEDEPHVRAAHRAHLRERKPYATRYRLRTKSGDWRWFQSKGQALWDDNGKPYRMVGSIIDITAQIEAEAELQRQKALGDLIRRIQESFIRDSDPQKALSSLLPDMLKVTGCEYGFIGEILYSAPDVPYLKAYALTDISWSDEIKKFYEEHAPSGLEFHSLNTLFGYSIVQKCPIISNSPKTDQRSGGLPHGHPPLNAFLGIPLMSGNEMVGQLGLANRVGGFDEAYIESIQPLVQTLGSIIAAWRADRARVAAEEELRWSNATLLSAERIARMGHWVRDLEKDESTWSDSMYQLMGIEPGTAPSPDIARLHIAPEYVDEFNENLAKARENGVGWDHEIELLGENGRRFWVRGIAEPILRDGKLVGLQGVLQDIDDQKKAETELQRVNTMLKSAERIAKLGHWYNDLVKGELYWSDTMYELADLDKSIPASDATGKSIVVPEYYDEFIRLAVQGREKGIPWEYEFEIIRGDGERIWARAIASPILQDGKPIAVQGILQDINQEKQAAIALAKSRESYELALHGAELGTWDLDLPTGTVSMNTRWAEMVGYSTTELGAEITAESLERLTHPEDLPAVHAAMEAHLSGASPTYEVEHRLLHKNGQWIWVLDKGRICERDPDGNPIRMSGTHLDITERKEAEHQIHQMNLILEQRVQERTAELQAANAELESFAYSVSHDLRSPLRALDGFAKVLGDDLEGRATETESHYLRRIRAAAQRMSSIIDSLLALSKTTRSQLTIGAVDLSGIAKSIASDLAISDSARVVQWEIQEGLTVTADPNLMRNLLENLLGNAWKYSGKKPIAEIRFGLHESTPAEDIFFVQDNGAGFDMAYVERMFKPFQRLHRIDEFDGTGVGLATVYRIVQRHGGCIRAEGSVGEGATIFFSIPRR